MGIHAKQAVIPVLNMPAEIINTARPRILTMDWIAAIFNIAALYLATRRNRMCWPVGAFGNALWVVYGLQTHQWSIVWLDLIMVAQAFFGMRKWSKR